MFGSSTKAIPLCCFVYALVFVLAFALSFALVVTVVLFFADALVFVVVLVCACVSGRFFRSFSCFFCSVSLSFLRVLLSISSGRPLFVRVQTADSMEEGVRSGRVGEVGQVRA